MLEHETIRDLSDIECDQVSGGGLDMGLRNVPTGVSPIRDPVPPQQVFVPPHSPAPL